MLTSRLLVKFCTFSCVREHAVVFLWSWLFLSACSGGPDAPSNAAPIFSGETRITVAENILGSVGILAASDPDGDGLTYALAGEDAHHFWLDVHSAEVRFVSPPDAESPMDGDADNIYEFTVTATDAHGASTQQAIEVVVDNVAFDYRVLSPLPNSILELERYSRLPIAVWVEYDFAEALQIIANGEIMNEASASGATWTGSIFVDNGEVSVDMSFWRGDQLLTDFVIPIKHQHIISAHANLAFDPSRARAVIPHGDRGEILAVDVATAQSSKHYPWASDPGPVTDLVFDPLSQTFIVAARVLGRVAGDLNSSSPLANNLPSDAWPGNLWGLALAAETGQLWVSAQSGATLGVLDLATGQAREVTYDGSQEPVSSAARLAYDSANSRLMVAPTQGLHVDLLDILGPSLLASWPLQGASDNPSDLGELAFDANGQQLYVAGGYSHRIWALDPANGERRVLSGADEGDPSGAAAGAQGFAPFGLALDTQRERLLALSQRRLLAVDMGSGEHRSLYGSVAGSGAVMGGLAGLSVAPDGRSARALGRRIGEHFYIDLVSGETTSLDYSPSPSLAAGYRVAAAQLNFFPALAIARYQSAPGYASKPDIWDLVDLSQGESLVWPEAVATSDVLSADWSYPMSHLVALVGGVEDPSGVQIKAFEYADQQWLALSTRTTGDVLAGGTIADVVSLRVHQHDYLLVAKADGGGEWEVALWMAIGPDQPWSQLVSFPFSGDIGAGELGLDYLPRDNLLALSLPGQAPRFWHVDNGEWTTPRLSTFAGADQPRDFHTIDDYAEVYYFLADAGLHFCWRFYCTVLAN